MKMHKTLRPALLAALFAPCFAIAAGSAGPYPKRALGWTVLPNVPGVSVQVGVSGRWESFGNPNLRPISCVIPADVFAFKLNETPALDNLAAHMLTTAPLPANPDWYLFGPTTDAVTLTIKVRDENRRLREILVKPLFATDATPACFDPDREARVRIPWENPYYRIDGISRTGSRVFTIVVGHGRPNTFAYFKVSRHYTPALPARYESSKGRVGDPYEPAKEDLVRDADSAARPARLAIRGSNDRESAYCIPEDLRAHDLCRRRQPGGSGSWPLFSNDVLGMQHVWDSMNEESREDLERPLKPIPLPAYTTATGVWSFKVLGTRTAYLRVPYTVAKQPRLFAFIQAAVDKPNSLASADRLGSALLARFNEWLDGNGKNSGLNREMVSIGNEIAHVDVLDEKAELTAVAPILGTMPIQLSAFTGAVDLTGRHVTAKVEIDPVDQLGAPAGFERGRTIEFDSRGRATVDLPKGHMWRLVGAGKAVQFSNYLRGERVEVPLGQIAYPDLVVFTYGVKGDKPANVRLFTKGGQQIGGTRLSRRTENGACSVVFANVVPGEYVVKCLPFGGKPVSANVEVQLTGFTNQVGVELN
jgi:hypothetical protein